MKRKSQNKALQAVKWLEPINTPIWIKYRFYEPNTRRDADNIASYAIKVIQDALVEAEIIPDDSQKYIKGYEVEFFTDKDNPRIEMEILNER